MINGMAAEGRDQALDRLPRAGLCHLGSLDEVDLGGSQCVDRDDAQLGPSAPRRDRREANRQRLANLIMP
jgi:hypothetical protein